MKKSMILSLTLIMAITNLFPVISSATPDLSNVESNEEKIQILDNEITNTMLKMDNLKQDIENTQKDIDDNKKKIVDIQKSYCNQKSVVDYKNQNYLQSNSKSDNLNMIEVLLKSNNVSNFLQNLSKSKQTIKSNNQSLKYFSAKEKKLNQYKKDLEDKKNDLNDKKTQLENDQKDLENMKSNVQRVIDEENEKKAEEALTQQLYNAKNNTNGVTTLRTGLFVVPNIDSEASPTAKKVIEESFKYLGVPYVWGGTSPSGFDCSGLMQYIYRTVGIELPRVSEEQQFAGKQVACTDLKPGDLIFWGYPAHHVGMYIGGGKYIQAPHTGDVVKISDVPSTVASACRVVTDY